MAKAASYLASVNAEDRPSQVWCTDGDLVIIRDTWILPIFIILTAVTKCSEEDREPSGDHGPTPRPPRRPTTRVYRPSDYNPLTGDDGGNAFYRPPRRGGAGGGGGG
ncbi:hypothetical protein LSAT2_017260 [Lamellibrachia satsuma]|nr:hypothetical protein LSAT2_017260 [Lamellibrachia satsuma]